MDFYRGGNSLKPTSRDVKIDRATGMLKRRGVSVSSRLENVARFGGAYLVTKVPAELDIVQHGLDPTHYEIVPACPMTLPEYEAALNKIVLIPV